MQLAQAAWRFWLPAVMYLNVSPCIDHIHVQQSYEASAHTLEAQSATHKHSHVLLANDMRQDAPRRLAHMRHRRRVVVNNRDGPTLLSVIPAVPMMHGDVLIHTAQIEL